MFKKILILSILLIVSIPPIFAKSDDIKVDLNNGIYTFKIPLKKYGNKIKPYVTEDLTTVSDVFNNKELNFKLVVNGGFFDSTANAPVSNVIIDKVKVQSLFSNLELVDKLNKENRIEQVINRSELRITENSKNKLYFDITNHFDILKEVNEEIKHSIQAGPMLIPNLRLEEESFIKYENNKAISLAADVLKRRERTVLGLKKDIFNNEFLYIIIFTSDKKVALNEARDYCIKLKLDKALAMDGGGSTSINYKNIEISSDKNGQRKVKSFLVIEN